MPEIYSPLNLNKQELRNPRLQNLGSAPSTPVEGQVYHDTGLHYPLVYNGTAWVPMSVGGIDWGETGDIDAITYGQAAGSGSLDEVARADHSHGMAAHDAAAHSAIKISDLAVPTADVSFAGFKITNVATPLTGTDAANKNYVDNAIQGLDPKASVRVATTAAGTLASSFENGDTIDGVVLVTADRILIKDQAAPADNGIYIVNGSGAPTRATDADAWGEIIGAFVWVEDGTANADTGWVSTANAGGTLGTTSMPWVQFTGAALITAGTGLTKTGNTINVGAGTGIVANADDVAVLRTDTNGRVPLKFALTFGDGAATSFNIDHNLNSLDVLVQVFRVSDGVEVWCDITRSTVNRVILDFGSAPTTNQFRVAIYG